MPLPYLQKHPVNAILTDIQMFQVSGLELAQWVQAQRSDIRVVILSGYDEIEYVHAAIESEAVDFLVKPVIRYSEWTAGAYIYAFLAKK